MRRGGRGRRRAADPGVPVPADRSAGGAAATGKVVNVKKGQFLAPWDMANVVAKITGAGNPNVLVTGTRRVVRLQHAGVGHAGAADPGAHDRSARDLRRHPFGAAARRQGHFIGRRARIRAGAGARRGGRRRRRGSSKPIPIPTTRPPTVPTWCRCATSKAWFGR